MVSKRLSIFGFISAAALVSGVLIGCGGSSSSVPGTSSSVSTTGGFKTLNGTIAGGTTKQSSFQQVQVTVNGAPVTGNLPAGEASISSSQVVTVIQSGVPFINGMSAPASNHKANGLYPVMSCQTINGTYVPTGSNMTSGGTLDKPIILGPGYIYLKTSGPFTIISVNGFSTSQITVQTFLFGVLTDAAGISSTPSNIDMRLPANGSTTSNGNYVNVYYPTPDFGKGTGYLLITGLASGNDKSQSHAVDATGLVSFGDPFNDPLDRILPGGVNVVEFLYTNP